MRKSIDHAARIADERQRREAQDRRNARYNGWVLFLSFVLSFLSFMMYLDAFNLTETHKIAERSIDLLTVPDTQEVFLPEFEIVKKNKIHFVEMKVNLSRTERNGVYVQLELCDTLERPYFQVIGDFYYDYGSDWTESVERVYDYFKTDTVGTFQPKIVVEKSANFRKEPQRENRLTVVSTAGAYVGRDTCNLVVRIYEKNYVEDYFLVPTIGFFFMSFVLLFVFFAKEGDSDDD